MYRNFVFDLYGTLVDIHTQEEQELLWEKMALFYGYQGAFYTPQELHDAFYDTVHALEAGQKEKLQKQEMGEAVFREEKSYVHEAFPEIQIEQVFQRLFLQKHVHRELDFAILTGQFFRALSTEYVRLYDGVKELFYKIREMGGKIYLLSNAQRAFTEYELKSLDLLHCFDGIMISSDCGTKKPDVRFFEMLLERYQLKPEESIMIGNDMSTDIAGAKAVGMDTFYLHSNLSPELKEEPEATYVQKKLDLKEVEKRLTVTAARTY